MRVIFAGGGTGGHLYPGLAIARALVRLESQVEPFFIGAQRGIEREVLPKTGFAHVLLDLHPIYRARPWQNWRTIAGLAQAWRLIGRTMRATRPAVVVGTGGYASGAALACALTRRIPIVLQEQNSYPGVTTRALSRFAREIYLGYAEASQRLPVRAGAWIGETGNPIEPPPSPRPERAEARARWSFPAKGGRVLLVFGGSQGARAVNDAVDAWIGRGLPDDLYVIWATGRASYQRFAHRASERVRVCPYLSPIEHAYAASDFALTRAGALTLAELCAWGIPPILVPLPTAASDHQTSNARALMDSGAALMIAQRELSAERIDRAVRALLEDPDQLAKLAASAAKRGRPQAADEIAQRILAVAHFPRSQP